jgi:ribosomal protein S6
VARFLGGPIRRERDGTYSVRLSEPEQMVVKSLLAQLRTLLKVEGGAGELTEDSGIRRLFPTAYPQREDLEAEYVGMVRDELLAQRLAAIDRVEETIVLPSLDEEQLATWLRTLNDLRLVLGTRLDVSEDMGPIDPEDPDAPALAAYEYLGWLLENTVQALDEALPEPTEPD